MDAPQEPKRRGAPRKPEHRRLRHRFRVSFDDAGRAALARRAGGEESRTITRYIERAALADQSASATIPPVNRVVLLRIGALLDVVRAAERQLGEEQGVRSVSVTRMERALSEVRSVMREYADLILGGDHGGDHPAAR